MDKFIDPLPLPFIGWFFTIVPLAVLVGGALLLRFLQTRGMLAQRYQKNYSVWNDMILLIVWGLGFMGGFGVLNRRIWGSTALEYFCWVMMILVVVNAVTRIKMLYDDHKRERSTEPLNLFPAFMAATLTIVPVVAMCGATIFTLHSDEVKQVFTAGPSNHSAPGDVPSSDTIAPR